MLDKVDKIDFRMKKIARQRKTLDNDEKVNLTRRHKDSKCGYKKQQS